MNDKVVTPEMDALLRRAGAKAFDVAIAAQRELGKALELPLKQGVLDGDITSDLFEELEFQPGQAVEYPLDFLSPGTEHEFSAYAMPSYGGFPQRLVNGDYATIQTYEVANTLEIRAKYLEEGRWDILRRAMEVLEGGFIMKKNTDGWRVALAAATGRNLNVYDDQVAAGYFSKRLIALMKTVMRRNAGGNSTSMNRGKLTRLYLSPESLEDVRSWDNTVLDEVTRREVFISDDFGLTRIFGVELRDLDELGVGQSFQDYYEQVLGGTMPTYDPGTGSTTKVEIVIGVDRKKSGAFVHPVRKPIELYEDPLYHKQRLVGWYGWTEYGYAQLESRAVLLGSI